VEVVRLGYDGSREPFDQTHWTVLVARPRASLKVSVTVKELGARGEE
jgi:hypothetical protein